MHANTIGTAATWARRLRVIAGSIGAVLGVALLAAPSAGAANLPQFQNGNGITVVGQSQNGREIDLTVTTTAVQGQHKIIVLLPQGYSAGSTTRYPTLYLLNGALADPTQWVRAVRPRRSPAPIRRSS
jgi:hypothetical protein